MPPYDCPVAGPLQLRVLNYLWENGPATVRQIRDAVNDEPGARPLAYTTMLTVARNLAKRGFCEQRRGGRTHTFAPMMTRQDYRAEIAAWLVNEQFGGDLTATVIAVGKVKVVRSAPTPA